MKRFVKIITVTFTCILFPFFVIAQNISIDGEIRPRTEYQDGYSKPISTSNDPGIFTSQRTRLNFGFTSGLLNTYISVQDARIFGQYANGSSEATTGIYEAWAEMVLMPGGSLKIGRQTIKYDDNRIFSAPTWNLTGTTHDLALFKYNLNDFQMNIGLAYNNNKETNVETLYTLVDKYRMLSYIWLCKPLSKGFTLSAIAVQEGTQDTIGIGTAYKKTNMNNTFTYGGNLKYEDTDAALSGLATAYFQSGKNNVGTKLNGKMLALKLNYNFSKKVDASIGTDYYSGDSNGTTDGTQSNFKNLYGANHFFNGLLDYWKTIPTQGLLDYYGGICGKISKKLSVEGGFHVFSTDKQLKSGGLEVGKDLGSEFDMVVNYKLNDWTSIQAGYCRYFDTTNTLLAKNIAASTTIRTPQWAYVMFCFKMPKVSFSTSAK